MTAGQRKTHLVLWLVLGLAALSGLSLALTNRPPLPVQDGPLPGAEESHPQTEQAPAPPVTEPALATDSGASR